MQRIAIEERSDWKQQAEELGFNFHTMYGAAYWDETACYRFSLSEIENGIEDPSAEIEQLCFQAVERAVTAFFTPSAPSATRGSRCVLIASLVFADAGRCIPSSCR